MARFTLKLMFALTMAVMLAGSASAFWNWGGTTYINRGTAIDYSGFFGPGGDRPVGIYGGSYGNNYWGANYVYQSGRTAPSFGGGRPFWGYSSTSYSGFGSPYRYQSTYSSRNSYSGGWGSSYGSYGTSAWWY